MWDQPIPERRSSVASRGELLGFIALALLALVPAIPADGRLVLGSMLAIAGVALFARTRSGSGATTIIAGIAVSVFSFKPPIGSWPFPFLLPIAGLCLAAFATRTPVLKALGARRGAFGRREAAIIALFAVMSAVALLVWAWLLRPDLSRVHALIPDVPIALLVPIGLSFSVINAIIEEIVWRGVLLGWLRGFMPVGLAVVVQALSFGAAHWMGVPSGWVGVGLAGVYGLMMGSLAVVARGLLAPIAAHIIADIVIFALVLTLA
jgi:hypothetical protein